MNTIDAENQFIAEVLAACEQLRHELRVSFAKTNVTRAECEEARRDINSAMQGLRIVTMLLAARGEPPHLH